MAVISGQWPPAWHKAVMRAVEREAGGGGTGVEMAMAD